MKKSAVIASSVLAVFIAGCSATNDNDKTNVGMNDRDQNRNSPKVNQVRYDTPKIINSTNNLDVKDDQTKDMVLSDDISKKLNELKEIKRSTVMVIGDHAYVAAELTYEKKDHFSKDVKKKISQNVREADKNIKHVYISTSPKFIQQMDQYASDVKNGKPISGLFDEFSVTVKRIFPQAF